MVGAEYRECREKKNARRGFYNLESCLCYGSFLLTPCRDSPASIGFEGRNDDNKLTMRHTAIFTWFGLSQHDCVCCLCLGGRCSAVCSFPFRIHQIAITHFPRPSLLRLCSLLRLSIPTDIYLSSSSQERHHATTRRCLQCGLGSLIYFQCSCGR